MTPEEAYKEALRRIQEAEETGAVELDLRGAINASVKAPANESEDRDRSQKAKQRNSD
jgi:hypothetical protein